MSREKKMKSNQSKKKMIILHIREGQRSAKTQNLNIISDRTYIYKRYRLINTTCFVLGEGYLEILRHII